MDVDETFSWTVGVTLLLQKVSVMMFKGGWLQCLRIQRQRDWSGLLAEPSKSFDDIDFANAPGRAPPALKKRFAANWYCHPTSREDESLFAKDSTAQVGQSLHR